MKKIKIIAVAVTAVVGLGAIAAKAISWRARRNAGNSEQELYCDCECE